MTRMTRMTHMFQTPTLILFKDAMVNEVDSGTEEGSQEEQEDEEEKEEKGDDKKKD